jgi:hypothetical protein
VFSLLLSSCVFTDGEETPYIVGEWVSEVSDIRTVTRADQDYQVRHQSEFLFSPDSSFQSTGLWLDVSGNVLGPYSIVGGRFTVKGNRMELSIERRGFSTALFDPALRTEAVQEGPWPFVVQRILDRLRITLICPPNANCSGPADYRRK